MRTVMLAAPSYDGTVGVWHACALSETAKIGIQNGVNIIPIYMSFDSLVQRARNDIVQLALKTGVDDLVFIDTDQDWNPQDFFKLLSHDVDVVGCPVPKKSDVPTYNIKLVSKPYKVLDNGLVEVDSVGTGFLRVTKDALQQLWDDSEEYSEDNKTCRMVFNIGIVDGKLHSEDVIFCAKWKALGGKVYIDPTIDSAHSGEKRWIGNFQPWIAQVTSNDEEI